MTISSKGRSSALKILLKILLAVAILYWLITQNKLDYRLVLLSLKNPLTWMSCFVLFLVQIFIGAVRWKIILQTKIKNISLYEVARIQWIGQFFSVILPGAVTGDLIKIGYIKSIQKNASKSFLLFSIFIDRLAGLNALLLLAGVSSLIFYNDLVSLNPLLKNIIYINVFLFLGSCGVITVFFLNKKIQDKIKSLIPYKKVNDLLETIWSFSDHKEEMLKVLLVSICTQLLAIACFWIINLPFFETGIKLNQLLSVIPLGQVTVALPISPAGLGVGHMAFDRLFHYIGHSNGASLFNVYWVVMFSANFCGIIPFIFSKEHVVSSAVAEQSEN